MTARTDLLILCFEGITLAFIVAAVIATVVVGDALSAACFGLLLGTFSMQTARQYGRWLRGRS